MGISLSGFRPGGCGNGALPYLPLTSGGSSKLPSVDLPAALSAPLAGDSEGGPCVAGEPWPRPEREAAPLVVNGCGYRRRRRLPLVSVCLRSITAPAASSLASHLSELAR